MKKRKAYCEKCDKDVDYVLEENPWKEIIRGEEITYNLLTARCKHCGGVVCPSYVTKIDLIRANDAYKRKVNLLTTNEIIEIRRKLGLTQEGLARKMGCGLKTITRYENGAIQDRVFDNFIRCLSSLHDFEQNKEKQLVKTKKKL